VPEEKSQKDNAHYSAQDGYKDQNVLIAYEEMKDGHTRRLMLFLRNLMDEGRFMKIGGYHNMRKYKPA